MITLQPFDVALCLFDDLGYRPGRAAQFLDVLFRKVYQLQIQSNKLIM